MGNGSFLGSRNTVKKVGPENYLSPTGFYNLMMNLVQSNQSEVNLRKCYWGFDNSQKDKITQTMVYEIGVIPEEMVTLTYEFEGTAPLDDKFSGEVNTMVEGPREEIEILQKLIKRSIESNDFNTQDFPGKDLGIRDYDISPLPDD